MLHACVQRFDVTGNLKKFCKILKTKQALSRPQRASGAQRKADATVETKHRSSTAAVWKKKASQPSVTLQIK